MWNTGKVPLKYRPRLRISYTRILSINVGLIVIDSCMPPSGLRSKASTLRDICCSNTPQVVLSCATPNPYTFEMQVII